jgi:hypothetical protein
LAPQAATVPARVQAAVNRMQAVNIHLGRLKN